MRWSPARSVRAARTEEASQRAAVRLVFRARATASTKAGAATGWGSGSCALAQPSDIARRTHTHTAGTTGSLNPSAPPATSSKSSSPASKAAGSPKRVQRMLRSPDCPARPAPGLAAWRAPSSGLGTFRDETAAAFAGVARVR